MQPAALSCARQRTSDSGSVTGLGAGAGAGRGGDAGFCVPSLAIVPAICCWVPASRSTLCRKLASAAGISLSCCNSCFSCAKSSLSCCSSGEAVACGAAAVCSGATCGTDAVSGANEASCGHEVAIIALAASPYNCQAKVVQTPIENTIRKRTRPREALLPSDGRIISSRSAIESSPARARSGWIAATSGWGAALRKGPPTLVSSPPTSAGYLAPPRAGPSSFKRVDKSRAQARRGPGREARPAEDRQRDRTERAKAAYILKVARSLGIGT